MCQATSKGLSVFNGFSLMSCCKNCPLWAEFQTLYLLNPSNLYPADAVPPEESGGGIFMLWGVNLVIAVATCREVLKEIFLQMVRLSALRWSELNSKCKSFWFSISDLSTSQNIWEKTWRRFSSNLMVHANIRQEEWVEISLCRCHTHQSGYF